MGYIIEIDMTSIKLYEVVTKASRKSPYILELEIS